MILSFSYCAKNKNKRSYEVTKSNHWFRINLTLSNCLVCSASHRFILLINSLINFKTWVDFEVSLRLGLRFYRSNSLMLFCSPYHFSTIKHFLFALVFSSNWQNSRQFKVESVRTLNRSLQCFYLINIFYFWWMRFERKKIS